MLCVILLAWYFTCRKSWFVFILLNEDFLWLFSHGRHFMRTVSSLDIDTLVVRPQTACWVFFSWPMRPSMSGHTFYQHGMLSLLLAFSLCMHIVLSLPLSQYGFYYKTYLITHWHSINLHNYSDTTLASMATVWVCIHVRCAETYCSLNWDPPQTSLTEG